jgi:hypothetical protein
MAKSIITDNSSIISLIIEYEYEDGLISKAYGLVNTPGIEEYTFEDIYKYSEEKILIEIIRYFKNWPSQIEYIRPSEKSLKVLMGELAEMFAEYILNLLLENGFNESLCYVILNYHYSDNFWPGISVMNNETRQQAIDNDTDFLFFNYELYEDITSENEAPKFLREAFKEFTQRIEEEDNYETGRKLLLKTAKLLTENKLQGRISITDDFVAFPIDWTLTEDLGELLLKCGAQKNKVKEWKSLNWF